MCHIGCDHFCVFYIGSPMCFGIPWDKVAHTAHSGETADVLNNESDKPIHVSQAISSELPASLQGMSLDSKLV